MVKPFQFSRLPVIYFGAGKLNLLPGLVRQFGNSILLVTDPVSFINSSRSSQLLESFHKEGISCFNEVISGEPSPGMIDAVVRRFRNKTVDAVVSVGGGSVIDAGKAISAMINVAGSVKDYLEGVGTREHPGAKIPFIALPTTSGTGSEATKNAVISVVGRDGFKKSLRHENFVPDIAVVDPELTVTCTPEITAASGMDSFTQLTESYLSVKANEYTDALAWEGLKAVKSSLRKCYSNGSDINARSDMSFAALTSGISLANAGLGAVHGFASSIGGMFSIPHGIICGTLMASANEVIVRELRKSSSNPGALKKYGRLGSLFSDGQDRQDDYLVDIFISYLKELTDDLKLPRLRQFGLDESDIKTISENTDVKNNPVRLSFDDLSEILYKRL